MFYLFPTAQAIGRYVSQLLVAQIQEKPRSVLGVATGSTMLPVYAEFVQLVQQSAVDVRGITTFNLDEYLHLSPEHPQSYHYFMQQHLFSPLNLQAAQTFLPNGQAVEMSLECQMYSEEIERCGVDVQLLGIGTNGHIGFNEPYTAFDSRTHVIELSENTRVDNSRFFECSEDMPTHAVTMGLADIMSAQRIVLVATGAHKAEVMAKLFNSPVTEAMPASILKQHSNVQILLDEAAARAIPRAALISLE